MVLDLTCSQHQEDEEYDSIGEHRHQLVLCDESAEPNNFESIVVNNSTDVHIGDKKIYNGSVTINVQCGDTRIEAAGGILALKDVVGFAKDNEGFAAEDIDIKKCLDKVLESQNGGVSSDQQGKWSLLPVNKKLAIIVTLVVALLIITVVTTVSLVVKSSSSSSAIRFPVDSNELDHGTPIELYDPSITVTLSGKLKIISRLEWVAQPPVNASIPLQHPLPYVILHQTSTENCTDQGRCTFHVRFLQNYHIESRGWSDIAFNFLVGGDGYVYEGRGWNAEGSHTLNYNARSLGVAFIGTFANVLPNDKQIIAVQQLIKKGVDAGYIAENYKLLVVNQLVAGQGVGKMLYEYVQTWPHWSKTP